MDYKELAKDLLEACKEGLDDLFSEEDNITILTSSATSVAYLLMLRKNIRRAQDILRRVKAGEDLTKKDVSVIVQLFFEVTYLGGVTLYRGWKNTQMSDEALQRRKENLGSSVGRINDIAKSLKKDFPTKSDIDAAIAKLEEFFKDSN